MNEEYRLIVREFKARIAQLMAQFNTVDSDKLQLQKENLALKEKINLLEQEKENLGRKYENLRVAKVIESGYNDNRDAKQKINKLLREIDKCIALLNK